MSNVSRAKLPTPASALRAVGFAIVLSCLVNCAPEVWPWDGDANRSGASDVRGVVGPVSEQPVELTVITYNTHGLKERFTEEAAPPDRRFPAIGRLLNGYDIALLQEDFAYHELIRTSAKHRIRKRGNGQDRNLFADLIAPFVCGSCGAGLSTLVDLDDSTLIHEYREAYEAYNGWIGGRYDAWVTKGFLIVRLRLDNGAVVDVYNTHLDAGKKKKRVKDRLARRSQLRQLRAVMERYSRGNAVIVGGDFNNRIDRPSEDFEKFVAAMSLREVAAQTGSQWRPRCDYIFYRSGDDVEIRVAESGEAAEFVDTSGQRLSDHPPIYARFTVRSDHRPGNHQAALR
jgi:hypothetical protein